MKHGQEEHDVAVRVVAHAVRTASCSLPGFALKETSWGLSRFPWQHETHFLNLYLSYAVVRIQEITLYERFSFGHETFRIA
jgi:hypothetical protein